MAYLENLLAGQDRTLLNEFQYFKRTLIEKLLSPSPTPYTDHGKRHYGNVEKNADHLLEGLGQLELRPYEILFLLYAIWVHDRGMWTQDEETHEVVLNRQHHNEYARPLIAELFETLHMGGAAGQLVGDLAWAHCCDSSLLDSHLRETPYLSHGEIRMPLLAVILRLADVMDCTEGRDNSLERAMRTIPAESVPHHESLRVTAGVQPHPDSGEILLTSSDEMPAERNLVLWRAGQIVDELRRCSDIAEKYGLPYGKVRVRWGSKDEPDVVMDKMDPRVGAWRYRPLVGLTNPYRTLESFEEEWSGLFFGRDNDIERLARRCMGEPKEPLIVITGESGVGKSSLIKAGLIPCLTEFGLLCIYARLYSSPQKNLRNAVVAKLPAGQDAAGAPLLALFVKILADYRARRVVVFIDQFEDFLGVGVPEGVRTEFMREIQIVAEHLDVSFVISIQKKLLGELVDFSDVFPNIPNGPERVQSLSYEQAAAALEKPASLCDPPTDYQQGLVKRILRELSRDPAQLQVQPVVLSLVGSRLYEAAKVKGSARITEDLYIEAGRVQGILSGHLNESLSRLPPDLRPCAKQLLSQMISPTASGERRIALSVRHFAERFRFPEEQVNDTVHRLHKQRIVDPTQEQGEFELVHEYLAEGIADWRSDDDWRIASVMYRLKSLVEAYRDDSGNRIDPGQIKMIYENRRGLTPTWDEVDALATNAKLSEESPADWFNWLTSCAFECTLEYCRTLPDELTRAHTRPASRFWEFAVESAQALDREAHEAAARAMSFLLEYHPIEQVRDRALLLLSQATSEKLRVAVGRVATDESYDFVTRTLASFAVSGVTKAETIEKLIEGWRIQIAADSQWEEDDSRLALCMRAVEAAHIIAWDIGKGQRLMDVERALAAEAGFDRGQRKRKEAVRALAHINAPEVIPFLMRSLDDDDSDIQMMAARPIASLLKEKSDCTHIQSLLERLAHNDKFVRKTAARILGEAGDEGALEGLESRLASNAVTEDPDVKMEILLAIAKLNPGRATAMLVSRLWGSEDEAEQAEILTALSEVGNDSALAYIDEFLRSGSHTGPISQLAELVRKHVTKRAAGEPLEAGESPWDVCLENPIWRKEEFCRVLYFIRTVQRDQFESAKDKLTARYGTTGRVADARHVARVLAADDVPDGREGRFVASFPETAGVTSVSEILTMIAGHCIGLDEIADVRIEQVALAPTFVEEFRTYHELTQHDPKANELLRSGGPFLYVPIYPRIGLSTDEYVDRCALAVSAGADIVADNELAFHEDERETSERVSRVVERIRQVPRVICSGCDLCGVDADRPRALYLVNVTGSAEHALKTCELAAENRADGFVINILTSGFSLAEAVVHRARELSTDEQRLCVFGYFNMHPLLTSAKYHGIDLEIFVRFARMIGVDIILIGVPHGFLDRKGTPTRQHIERLRRYWKAVTETSFCGVPAAVPAVAGGISWSNLQANKRVCMKKFDQDVCFVVGSGAWRYPVPTDRTRAIANIRRMACLLRSREDISDVRVFLRQCPLLEKDVDNLTIDLVDPEEDDLADPEEDDLVDPEEDGNGG